MQISYSLVYRPMCNNYENLRVGKSSCNEKRVRFFGPLCMYQKLRKLVNGMVLVYKSQAYFLGQPVRVGQLHLYREARAKNAHYGIHKYKDRLRNAVK